MPLDNYDEKLAGECAQRKAARLKNPHPCRNPKRFMRFNPNSRRTQVIAEKEPAMTDDKALSRDVSDP